MTALVLLLASAVAQTGPGEAWVAVEGSPPLPPPGFCDSAPVLLEDSVLTGLRERMLDWYLSEGYPFASVGLYLRSADTLVARVVPGRHALLEEVRFDPDPMTRDDILLRFLGISPGDPYSAAEVEDWKRRLERLDFIEGTGETGLALGSMGNLVLIQEIEEKPMGYFAASMGFSGTGAGERTEGGGEVYISNLLGTARELDLSVQSVEWGGVDAAGRYREPWILGTPLSAELRASQLIPESLSVDRELEAVVILELQSLETWVGAGIWKGFQPDSADREYSYGIAGAGVLVGRRVPQGWSGFRMELESRLGVMSGADSGFVLATMDTEMRADWFHGALGIGSGLLAGGIVEGDWIYSRLTRLGGIASIRGYAAGSFRAGRYLVVRPEISLGETATRIYAFSDLAVLDTPDGIRYPVGAGAGIRGRTGVLELDAGIGFPVLDGLSRARFYLRALASVI